MGNLLSGEGGVEEQPVPHEVAMAVLEQLDWKSRAHLLSLDRRWAFDIARDPQTWHVMCERLEIEHGVFVPRLDPARRSEWKEVFQKMAAFHALQESGAENTFAIKVCVRFRPLAPRRAPAAGAAGAPVDKAKHIAILKSLLVRKQESVRRSSLGEGEGLSPTIQAEIAQIKHELAMLEPPRMVNLPLHQRLQLIQAEHKCSARKARKILGDIMRAGQEHDPWSGAMLAEDAPAAAGGLSGGAGGGEVAAPVVGSSAFTKSVRGALLEQDSLSEPQRLALGRLQAAKSTATPTVFVEQEVGRWLGTARSPRRTALATARTELGVLQELKESLAEQQAQAEQEEAAERAEVEAEDSRTAELEWQADEERRCAAVTAAKAEILRLEQARDKHKENAVTAAETEILRLEQASIDEETARVRRDIATLQRELGLPVAAPPVLLEEAATKDPEAAALEDVNVDAPHAPGAQPGVLSSSDAEVWCADPSKGIRAFRYGQTGSGKSHTMFGSSADDLVLRPPVVLSGEQQRGTTWSGDGGGVGGGVAEQAGLVPRCCSQLLEGIRRRRQLLGADSGGGYSAVLKVSYVQVFGDEVTDLLYTPPAAPRAAAAAAGGGGAVEGGDEDGAVASAPVMTLTAAHTVRSGALDREVNTEEEMSALLLQAEGAKRRAATLMNERSSRAHSLLFLNLQQTTRPTRRTASGASAGSGPGDALVKRSQLCLGDLGGSEQVKKSGVAGARLQEAVNINLGLLSLKNVISHLHRKADYVPFSDNRLTELLRESLGGRSKTVVVVAARLEPPNAAETLHALRFGERCRQISETVGAGGSTMATALALIESLNRQIAGCEARIEADERWETRTIVTQEESTNLFTGETEMAENRKVVSVLVGAEEHRAELERLLAQRSALLGH